MVASNILVAIPVLFVWLFVASTVEAAFIRDYFKLDGFELTYQGDSLGDGVRVSKTVITKREIIRGETSFFTIYDDPAQWHSFLYVTGYVDQEEEIEPQSYTTVFNGSVYLKRELSFFYHGEPFGNLVRSSVELNSSSLDGGSFTYDEMEECDGRRQFFASIHVHGRFPDPEMGRAFAVPEPASTALVIVAVALSGRLRRHRRA